MPLGLVRDGSERALRVAILTSGVPHPSRGASAVLFFQYIAAIRGAGHVLFHAVLSGDRDVCEEGLAEYRAALELSDGSSIEVFAPTRAFEARRLSVLRLDDGLEPVRARLSDFLPDAIVAFDLEAAAAAAPVPCPLKTVWLGDLNFQSTWYNYLYAMRESPLRMHWLPYALAQRRAWKRHYADTLRCYNPIIASSKSSERELGRLVLKSRYEPYPWPAPAPAEAVAKPLRPTFLFFGNLVGLGSRSALHFMFSKVVPRLRKMWGGGGFRILIAGHAQLRDWASALIDATPEVEFLGFVEDLPGLIAQCHAVLVPIDVPVGNRSRIVTAMALKGLVIAHRNAALGNPSLVHEHNVVLFETAAQMAEQMRLAVDDPERFAPVIDAARNTYVCEFAPDVAAPLFANVLETIRGEVRAAA